MMNEKKRGQEDDENEEKQMQMEQQEGEMQDGDMNNEGGEGEEEKQHQTSSSKSVSLKKQKGNTGAASASTSEDNEEMTMEQENVARAKSNVKDKNRTVQTRMKELKELNEAVNVLNNDLNIAAAKVGLAAAKAELASAKAELAEAEWEQAKEDEKTAKETKGDVVAAKQEVAEKELEFVKSKVAWAEARVEALIVAKNTGNFEPVKHWTVELEGANFDAKIAAAKEELERLRNELGKASDPASSFLKGDKDASDVIGECLNNYKSWPKIEDLEKILSNKYELPNGESVTKEPGTEIPSFLLHDLPNIIPSEVFSPASSHELVDAAVDNSETSKQRLSVETPRTKGLISSTTEIIPKPGELGRNVSTNTPPKQKQQLASWLKGKLELRVSTATVVLAPSGTGKTRGNYETLCTVYGFFIQPKATKDKNHGSMALSEIMKALESHQDMKWNEKIDLESVPFSDRRERAEFGIKCVVTAYMAVFCMWSNFLKEKPNPRDWLLFQLFPGDDIFTTLAMKLFTNCFTTRTKFPMYNDCRGFICIVDEAQVLSKTLVDNFLPEQGDSKQSSPTRKSLKLYRSFLSPVLHGIFGTLSFDAIISGTGLSLMAEYDSVVTRVASPNDLSFLFVNFELLDEESVSKMLKVYLNFEDRKAARWLRGRPRFTTLFIQSVLQGKVPRQNNASSRAIESPRPGHQLGLDSSYVDILDDFINWMTKEQEGFDFPITIAASFKLLEDSPLVSFQDKTFVHNRFLYSLFLTFKVSLGLDSKTPDEFGFLECGIGHIWKEEGQYGGEIRAEPIILETARLIRENTSHAFDKYLIQVTNGNASAAGKTLELVCAIPLANYLSGDKLENMLLPQSNNASTTKKKKVAEKIPEVFKKKKVVIVAEEIPEAFKKKWEFVGWKYGAIGQPVGSGKRLYEWLESGLKSNNSSSSSSGSSSSTVTQMEQGLGLALPNNGAGPDIVYILRSENCVLLVLAQIKLQTTDGEVTVDPSKMYHEKRGLPDEVMIETHIDFQIKFLTTLLTKNIPVLRLVLSGLKEISSVELIQNDRKDALKKLLLRKHILSSQKYKEKIEGVKNDFKTGGVDLGTKSAKMAIAEAYETVAIALDPSIRDSLLPDHLEEAGATNVECGLTPDLLVHWGKGEMSNILGEDVMKSLEEYQKIEKEKPGDIFKANSSANKPTIVSTNPMVSTKQKKPRLQTRQMRRKQKR
jgi:hypothetical protein